VLPELGTVQTILADPPYHRVLDVAWDREHGSRAAFLAWLQTICKAFRDCLAANGTLGVFAFPDLASGVEETVRASFEVLNHLVWEKANGALAKRTKKSELRHFLNLSERILLAEHYGSDTTALTGSGYGSACERLHGFVFEPLRAYLDGERLRAGIRHREVIAWLGMTGHDSHFFSPIQWKLPLPEQYAAMRQLFNRHTASPEYLRREYEDLRREYEDLRRPFTIRDGDQYGDVLRFNTSSGEGTYHPAQKPLALMSFLVRVTTPAEAVVLDPFAGSGTTAVACARLGRCSISIEREPAYCAVIVQRLEAELAQPLLFPVPSLPVQQGLFAATEGAL
jgi:site-specific DNA-methyltransferase (adenine-specific)